MAVTRVAPLKSPRTSREGDPPKASSEQSRDRCIVANPRIALALCSVSILSVGLDQFTVLHVTGKNPECGSICPIGSQLPALKAVLAQPGGGSSSRLRYNSIQVLQLLQSSLLYSFSDPLQGSQEIKEPPYDWQALYGTRGLTDFCALPLIHAKSVVGAVTLAFDPPPPPGQQAPGLGRRGGLPSVSSGPCFRAALLMRCDESSLRALGLLLSVLLAGQDLKLAQQVGDILAGVHDARTLQQVVAGVAAGVERVLQLKTHVTVAVTVALLPGSAAAAAAAVGAAGGNVGGGGGGVTAPSSNGGRAIFFEERGGSGAAAAGGGNSGGGGGSGCAASGGGGGGGGQSANPNEQYGARGIMARSTSAATREAQGGSSHDGCTGQNGSYGALLWQASTVQARALGLRHTLLANLPSGGTVVHDCASYMQQVGCPKRDLYLLSSSKGIPPFSLAIAPAPLPLLRDVPATGGGGGGAAAAAQLVLYVSVGMRLPLELLNEVLAQAQHLSLRFLAPLIGHKLARGDLAEEWILLVGKCFSGRGGGGGGRGASVGGGTLAATESHPDLRPTTSAVCNGTSGGETAAAAAAATAGNGGSGCGEGSRGQCAVSPDDGCSRGSSNAAPAGTAGCGGVSAAAGVPPAPHPGHPREKATPTPTPTSPPPTCMDASTSRPAGGEAAAAAAATVDAGPPVAECPVVTPGPDRMLSAIGTPPEPRGPVLSTALAGAFAGDTRAHMGLLVSSFKETINALQALRADEYEELSVLKLGKVLGRGGSGLVFQGYLHMGLEVAVKLFENPDDTDREAVSSSEHASTITSQPHPGGGGAAADGLAATEAAAAAAGGIDGGIDGGTDTAAAKGAVKGQPPPALPSTTAAAALATKRQRDLLHNALELGVASSLSHPNIVQGYCHWVNVVLMQDASLNRCWLMGQAEYLALAPPGSPPPPLCSALVMEYCDMGSLVHALKRGTFTAADGKTNMEFVYMCLLEIALALRHLHTAKLAHCDLKPGNVLLRSSPRDPRGFVCKLGDFGYAAILKDGLLPGRPAVLPDEACGTLQYMAPELFVSGRPVDASIDVYAFGMLMWELITGRTPYSECDYPSRSLMKAVYHGKRPSFPGNTLSAYRSLAVCCWSPDLNSRPSASALVKLLRQQLESLKHQSSTGSSSAPPAVGPRAHV
ncbi:hypothetical protein VOLCADRAFT_89150 [Volvox carteri f. nagariensis]|uniref:Protein kinase domain-containing protein n=1 Tax=Volvox carteri f. nagariensis TaxID=3068 RepID=D8TQX6_VOLCA|nr:uncharacterized protein VOLCADRAFT_89150 [Volvox carteri f. nagariensis]EFJ50234.1 hypothetical protein VOLCADRAFT_89150 [Volvox carteri f. nagariensis]|eukprot:XP_002948854.1 hypothetical protein VOLCADRAFT_89150 [Volvox carteri f. nagariensis]